MTMKLQVICLLFCLSLPVNAADCSVAVDQALADLQQDVWGELSGERYHQAREILARLCREGSVTVDQQGNRVYSTAPIKSERLEPCGNTSVLDVYGVDVDLPRRNHERRE